jgi:hypothetical protein
MELPPVSLVELSEDRYAYIDGRTRGAARAYLNLPDVPAIVSQNPEDASALFVQALAANWGGAKPPTRGDIIHTITRMREAGASQKQVRESLTFVPPGSLRAYMASSSHVIMNRKIAKSLDAIAAGHTIEEAAKMYAVPVPNLQDVVSGKKGKWGHGRSDEADYVLGLKNYISRDLRSSNSGISKKMTDLLMKVDNGEVSVKAAEGVLRAWAEHLRKSNIRAVDWQSRLTALDAAHVRSATSEAA